MRLPTTSRAVIAGIALLALMTTACSGPSEDTAGAATPPAVTDGTVSMTLDGPLTGYDPARASTFQDAVAMAAMYDTLVYFDPSGALVPGLAETWESTPTTAIFHIRDGVSCSDGTALTGEVVANSLNRLFDPATASSLVSQVIGSGNSATAKATDNAVTVTLATPWSDLVNGMTGPSTGIVCPSGLSNPDSLAMQSAGTGAFVSASQVAGSSYTMTRRPDHTWGPGFAASLDGELPSTLVLNVIDDENTRANLLSTGELQIGSFSSDVWSRFEATEGVHVETSAQSDTMLLFNSAPGHPTADKAVRLAISQAIDRAALNAVQSYGVGELLTSLGQPNYECFDPGAEARLPAPDPAAAATSLKGVQLRLIGTNILAGGDANDYLQASLQAAGATVSVSTTDNQAWVSELFSGKGNWDVTIFVYGNRLSSMIAIGNFMVRGAPPRGLNLGATDNPAAAAAFEQATTATGAEKCSALTTFQQALLDNNDVLPLATAPVHVLFGGGTSGVVVKGFAVPSSIRIGGTGR